MNHFVPKEKMSKKARKQVNAEKRTTWAFAPTSRVVESKKVYNRKKISRVRHEDTRDFSHLRGGAFFYLAKLSVNCCHSVHTGIHQ